MLINVAKWRAQNIGKRVIEYLMAHCDELQMGDQDGLNAILHDDWKELAFRWNWQIVPRVHRVGPARCWIPAESERSIIHFSTFEKPWRPGCQLDERKYFFEALDRTIWAGWRIPLWQEAWVSIKQALHRLKEGLTYRLGYN
jgi:lipopolysaccharide biosynthesis glycosyltransferase